ncbi:Microtubule-associated protein RP/EB family member 1 [Sarcoptes scabiei]|nr:Microtubule-associated protein RP/EB family member 1 [Sarcoptes scabiei]
MMIMTSTATVPSSSHTKTDIKQMNICLPSNSAMELPIVTSTSNINSINIASLTTTSKNITNATSFLTASNAPGHLQMRPLSVMVAKINQPSNRQQPVCMPRMSTTRGGATLQIQNSIRSSSTPTTTNISNSTYGTSNMSSISVRRFINPHANHTGSMPIINITTSVSSNVTSSVKQVVTGQKFFTTAGNVETVNLVMANPNDVRNLKTNTSNEIKSLYTVNKINGPKQLTGSALVTNASKMVINNAGQSCTTRLGILSNNTTNKTALINLSKNFILAPTGSSGITNMVSISSANFLNRIPNQIIARQTVATTLSQAITSSSTKPAIFTVNTNSNVITSNIITTLQPIITTNNNAAGNSQNISTSTVSLSTNSIMTTSSKSSVQSLTISNNSSNLSSLKSNFSPTLVSPRPRILSRKRPIEMAGCVNSIGNTVQLINASNHSNISTITLKSQNGSFLTHQQSSTQSPSLNLISTNLNPSIQTFDPQKTYSAVGLDKDQKPTLSSNNSEVNSSTPRKKPRKQLLEPTSPKFNSYEIDRDRNEAIDALKNNEPYNDESTIVKKPRPSLIHQSNYMVRIPHLPRYSDMKHKNDKKSIQDLLNDLRKENEWKDLLLSEQCKKLADDEKQSTLKSLEIFLSILEERISPFSKCAETNTLYHHLYQNNAHNEGELNLNSNNLKIDGISISLADRKCVRINDIIRANIQRSKLIVEQLIECSQLIQKITSDHKEKVANIAKKINYNNYTVNSKRNYSR